MLDFEFNTASLLLDLVVVRSPCHILQISMSTGAETSYIIEILGCKCFQRSAVRATCIRL